MRRACRPLCRRNATVSESHTTVDYADITFTCACREDKRHSTVSINNCIVAGRLRQQPPTLCLSRRQLPTFAQTLRKSMHTSLTTDAILVLLEQAWDVGTVLLEL